MKGIGQRAPNPTDDVPVLRSYLEQVAGLPIINGQLVTGVVPDSQPYVRIKHALGRPYIGGLCAGVSFVVSAFVQTPAAAVVAGIDIKKEALIFLEAPVVGHDVTVLFWLF